MATMDDDEIRSFLSSGTRTAKVATVRADGRPHVAPVWFAVDDDGSLVFTTGAGTVKGRNLRRDPRVSISVDEEDPPYSFVLIDGTAELSDDIDELSRWATTLGGRYMGEDRAEAFGRRNAVPGELLVRIRPSRTAGQKDIAD